MEKPKWGTLEGHSSVHTVVGLFLFYFLVETLDLGTQVVAGLFSVPTGTLSFGGSVSQGSLGWAAPALLIPVLYRPGAPWEPIDIRQLRK